MRYRILATLILIVVFLGTLFLIVQQKRLRKEDFRAARERLEASSAFEAMRWYNAQRAYPTGDIPEDWRQKAADRLRQNSLEKTSTATAVAWSALGPTNVGGRVRSVAIDPTNANVIFCGSVSGGIWKTTNAGTSWFAISDTAPNLVIGCLAIDPANPSTIYAGTGEGYFNVDALRGAGVLKSTDAGASWTLLTNFSTPNPTYSYYFINKLVIRSDNSNVVFAAMDGGIWKTTNGGTSWGKLTIATTSTFCVDLIPDPSSPNIMYAAFGLFSTDGIYKTTDGGTSWNKLTNGFPTSGYARISIGIARSNPSILYAVLDDATTHDTHSIQKSTDGGASWSAVSIPNDVGNGTSHLGGQGWYNNAIAVHPTNANTVIVGGVNMFKSTDGGTSWLQVSNGNGSSPPNAHVDQHALVFDTTNVNILYVGNDGGMYKSTNSGSSYSPINTNLSTVQFYSAAVHPTQTIYYGGTQDNGTLKSTGAASSWSMILSGDGGVTAVDFTTPTTIYTEYIYLSIYKSTNSGLGWTKVTSGIPAPPAQHPEYGTSDRCTFIAPYTMDPSNSLVLAAGTFKVYRTTNGGAAWSSISTDLTGDGDGTNGVGDNTKSTITALAIAKTSSATIYVGTSGSGTVVSKVQVTTNTGATWTDRTGTLPDLYVKSFSIDPANAAHAFVTFSGFGAGHIYTTVNTGLSWTNVSGNLPDIPVNSIVIDPNNVNHLIVGTDLGIFESANNGTAWAQRNTGLANVSVDDLELRSDGILFAATHGRGMFKTTGVVGVSENTEALPAKFALGQNYPNPFNPSTTISFTVGKQSLIRLKVYDALGRLVSTLVDGELPPGSYTSTFNAGNFASGVYYYTLEGNGATLAKKMLLLK